MQWISQHKLIAALLVVVLAIGVWFGLSRNSTTPPLLTSDITNTGSPSSQSSEQELVGTLLELRSVNLNGTIFNDRAFMSLHDFGTTIVAEPVGRTNPFAPLSQRSASPVTQPQSPRR
ncbi:hypothetical protein HY970_03945 [Candidatus Kaiserbacteria bacterium]|nr:hypothetical protein [Candidatus Kaiserbacteria bacterium]